MKKKVINGWIGRSKNLRDMKHPEDVADSFNRKRGNENLWFDYNWPPKKVKITIEVME